MDIKDRDWSAVEAALDAEGHALLPALLDADRCAELRAGWADRARYRSEVVMARHGYGSGAYRYFAYPLPDPIAALRAVLYPPLARIANRWATRRGGDEIFPDAHADFLVRCHQAGQA